MEIYRQYILYLDWWERKFAKIYRIRAKLQQEQKDEIKHSVYVQSVNRRSELPRRLS